MTNDLLINTQKKEELRILSAFIVLVKVTPILTWCGALDFFKLASEGTLIVKAYA